MSLPIIIKGDGNKESFAIEKLTESLRRSGTDEHLAEAVAKRVGATVKDGMTTTAIYQEAFKVLRKEERVSAARYSMRRAILDLGPTGFPFEKFVAALMHAKGYETSYGITVQGRCIDHEVDVVMRKDGKAIGAELKFHNTPGFKTDLKTALYVRARYWDIQWGAEDREEKAGIDEGWLVTNTKFTSKAIQYSNCSGIKLLGWSYPDGASLSDFIRETGVYPITILTTLSQAEKNRLLQSGVTMCHMVMSDPDSLKRIGIPAKKQSEVVAESKAICQL
ncbi:MAG: nuclease [Parcubacteria group bacterium Greene0714_7]|nr:MAG: nuclease [Parcubacteria group bacterium Greene0714_7]